MNFAKPLVYAVKHKNPDVRANSRSGGIFTALSDLVLADGGAVYGCVLTENFTAVHFRAVTLEERNHMRGSKYIQSTMGDIFKQVRKDVDTGKIVLFSGTSCQIAGLKSFLGKEYNNLLCIDIVCHGVPSPMVWEKYLEWQASRHKSKIVRVDFRNKTDYGWAAHVESLYFANGKKVDSQVFTTLFYGHAVLRPCCYKCPYKDIRHPGDITIADYWGIDKAAPGFNDNKGVSLVLINSDNGKSIFENVKMSLEYAETKIENSLQGPLITSFYKPENRELFWQDFFDCDFTTMAQRYGGLGRWNDKKLTLKRMRFVLEKIKRKLLKY